MRCSRLPGLRCLLRLAIIFSLSSCGLHSRIAGIGAGDIKAALNLPDGRALAALPTEAEPERRDTLKILAPDGKEYFLMDAVRDDDDGEMVAAQRLTAAYVTARFSNVAERGGRVDLHFCVVVPENMMDPKWQLRMRPVMYVLSDTLSLDEIFITGEEYRRRELRGYEQYERYLSRIIGDDWYFVRVRDLEIFVERNIPELYAFRTDSSYVSDETFHSKFGVTTREAIEHYTRHLALRRNERLKERDPRMQARYLKSPSVEGGVRLDTVMSGENGELIYDYVQTLNVRPGMRRADIVLSGEILEYGSTVCSIAPTDPLTFYISSLSTLADHTERYVTTVISRNASITERRRIVFAQGSSEIDPLLEDNASEIGLIKRSISRLANDRLFELDSVSVMSFASPEGNEDHNVKLSVARAKSVAGYFNGYVGYLRDSLEREAGVNLGMIAAAGPSQGYGDEDFSIESPVPETLSDLVFLPKAGGENWNGLDLLVAADSLLTREQKEKYLKVRENPSADEREALMRGEDFYPRMSEALYPLLRDVKLDFALSRKGMIKDTVHTTQLDTNYMKGVRLLSDYDYRGALELLSPYEDYNTAVAYLALDRNHSAAAILSTLEKTPAVCYMLALVNSRMGDYENAVKLYLEACRGDRSFVSRGNLDPEIASLVRRFSLDEIIYDMI